MTETAPIIQLRHLTKVFSSKDDEVTALDDINLDIYSGEIFGIIGMSGAGKSTLVRCINLLERPSSGQVIFDGEDIVTLPTSSLNQRRKQMGMIFQQFNLLMQRTTLSNVCFPMLLGGSDKTQAIERAKELLEIVGLSDKANVYPAQLSGGQKQRVAIARALATNPKVLLCDEATSALDPATTQAILSLLKDINQRLNITIVIITHEMSVIEKVCQRVAIIDDGCLAEVSTVEELFVNPKSAAARKFILPSETVLGPISSNRYCRLVFNGSYASEPIIANMVMDCKEAVSILYADMKSIDGKTFGHMVLQLPDDERSATKVTSYLKMKGVTVEEVDHVSES